MEKIKYNLTVIYILWLRQLKRHFRARARVFASIGQPLLFLIALGFGFQSVFAQAGQGDYLEFLIPGIISMSIVFSSMFGGIEVIADKQFGFLKETLVAPVSRITIMIGRTLGGATVAVFQGLMVMAISLLFGFMPASLPLFLLALILMFIISVLFTALGTAFASFFNDMHAFPVIINFVVMPLFFLSGALFPLEGLPRVLTVIVTINPLSYGVDALRGALVGLFHYGLTLDLTVLLVVTIGVLLWGSFLFRKIEV